MARVGALYNNKRGGERGEEGKVRGEVNARRMIHTLILPPHTPKYKQADLVFTIAQCLACIFPRPEITSTWIEEVVGKERKKEAEEGKTIGLCFPKVLAVAGCLLFNHPLQTREIPSHSDLQVVHGDQTKNRRQRRCDEHSACEKHTTIFTVCI